MKIINDEIEFRNPDKKRPKEHYIIKRDEKIKKAKELAAKDPTKPIKKRKKRKRQSGTEEMIKKHGKKGWTNMKMRFTRAIKKQEKKMKKQGLLDFAPANKKRRLNNDEILSLIVSDVGMF